MGEKNDEDPLTYEELQRIIDDQLAHLEALQVKEELKDIEKIINPVDVNLEKKSRVIVFWQSLKKLIVFIFKHRR